MNNEDKRMYIKLYLILVLICLFQRREKNSFKGYFSRNLKKEDDLIFHKSQAGKY